MSIVTAKVSLRASNALARRVTTVATYVPEMSRTRGPAGSKLTQAALNTTKALSQSRFIHRHRCARSVRPAEQRGALQSPGDEPRALGFRVPQGGEGAREVLGRFRVDQDRGVPRHLRHG